MSRLFSSLHLCLCLIGPRSTLDQHRRLISPPATRQHSPSPKRTQLFPYLVPPSDTVRCMSVGIVGMQLGSTTDTINNSNINNLTISHTHHSHLTSTHTLTVRINAHPSPVQHLPPPPYHSCNVTLVSRDNGFLRASAVAPINPIHLPACVSNQGRIPCSYPSLLLTCTPL